MKPGDKVQLTTCEGEFIGTLLPRPELLSNDITVLKLPSGYNIGIETKKIKKKTLLEEYQTPLPKKTTLSHNNNLPTVAILSTGGTISSRVDYRTGGVASDYSAQDFVAMCPELAQIANLKTVKVMSMMSEDAMTNDWKTMADAIQTILPKADGVVITHGTDTMHYTSAALSFLLKDLCKPVIITGAQRSIDRGSSDAFMNLICAVKAAAQWNAAEIAICMHATMNDDYCQLLRGTKVRKMHSSRRDAFRAINDEPLARVYPAGKIETTDTNYRKRGDTSTNLRSLGGPIALIHIHPDIDPGIINYHIKQKVKAILLAATGLGNVPLHNTKTLAPALKKAKQAKIPVFICTQTIYGRAHSFVYNTMRDLSITLGAHYLGDMLPETAYAKLCVALKEKNPIAFMNENIAGEYTDREVDDSFLR